MLKKLNKNMQSLTNQQPALNKMYREELSSDGLWKYSNEKIKNGKIPV